MVQQTTDSMFSECILANPETVFSKHDKQVPVPQTAKKTALRDLQNVVPKSDGSSVLKNNGPAVKAVNISGIKRPQPECIMRAPAITNSHLVYVRRKTESEQHKSSTCNKTNDQPKKLHEHDEKIHEESPMKDSTICIQKDVPEPKTSYQDALGSEKSNMNAPVTDSDCQHLEELYFRLQNFLKALDQSSQDDYCQMLRSLSSVDLSSIAVELEKRSIQLSLEEAREVQRAKFVDVLDKFPRSAEERP